MKILKKSFNSPLFYCLKVWTCEQEGVFLFHVFFLPCTLQNLVKKVWTGGQVMKISEKNVSTYYVLLCKSVDMWTIVCLSISYFFFVIYPSQIWQKVWTGGHVINIMKKSFNLLYFIAWKCGHVDKKLFFYFIFSITLFFYLFFKFFFSSI